ncbi:MAG TPA: hypothetical protein VFX21_05205 [Acidimicrobiia bacterium]|nr:hypothetical protein [Acidimicrobiia bacterium]
MRSQYLDRIREIPMFGHCSTRELTEIARLIDRIELPAGTALASNTRELLLTTAPTEVLVIDRRALAAVLELVADDEIARHMSHV